MLAQRKPRVDPAGYYHLVGGRWVANGWWTKCPGEAWKFSTTWEDAIRVALIWCKASR